MDLTSLRDSGSGEFELPRAHWLWFTAGPVPAFWLPGLLLAERPPFSVTAIGVYAGLLLDASARVAPAVLSPRLHQFGNSEAVGHSSAVGLL